MGDRQVMACIEVMVDAWRKGRMTPDQAVRSIVAYINDIEQRRGES